MQTILHNYLRDNHLRVVPQGSAILTLGCGSNYKAIAHAVAIDVFYGTSPDWIVSTYETAIHTLATAGCRSIAAACLGCGYGRCPPSAFADAIKRLMACSFPEVDEVTFVTTSSELVECLKMVIV